MIDSIILATTSLHRINAFRYLGINFTSEGSNIDEKFEGRPENPEELVSHLARLKAESVAKKRPRSTIIGFDSVAYFKGKVLEKPESKQEAFERLKKLSGNDCQFYTGIHMINPMNIQTLSRTSLTKFSLRNLDEEEIIRYLDEDQAFNTYALGFDPLQGLGATFILEIRGSYNNILRGVPLELIVDMLKECELK